MLSQAEEHYTVVGDTFAEASNALGYDLWALVSQGPEDQLTLTEFTQPAILTASVALYRCWQQEGGPSPEFVAGHSLGEYSALVCAGALQFQDAVRIVHARGQFMQSAVPAGTGKMAAIVGLENQQINEICDEAEEQQTVSAANFNSPGQTVIAGNAEAVDRAIALCKEAGAKRALPLNVSVPSHCELMRPAAKQLSDMLDSVAFNAPQIGVVQNVNAEIATDPQQIKANLIKQLYAPVLWVDCVQVMHKAGLDKIVECGPGRVLCGLIKRIESALQCCGSDDLGALESARAEVTG